MEVRRRQLRFRRASACQWGTVLRIGDHNVYAVDDRTGTLLWSFTADYQIYTSPAVVNGVVYVGTDSQSVYALDANTGAQLWKYTTAGNISTSATVANGLLYISLSTSGRSTRSNVSS
jgi:eukaryotic-like serine/threonine-protein kinase